MVQIQMDLLGLPVAMAVNTAALAGWKSLFILLEPCLESL